MNTVLINIIKFRSKPVKNMPDANPWTTADVLIVAGVILMFGIIYWWWKKRK